MFSGIVEAKVDLLEYTPDLHEAPGHIQIKLERPEEFGDVRIGDSIAVNGICLTVEDLSEEYLQFSMGAETISVVELYEAELRQHKLNLERSLRFNDRVHGHVVSGHVDSMGIIVAILTKGESRIFQISIPEVLLPYVWKKGSLCVNGVSLTVNDINDSVIEVCLIPETLRRTNLADLRAGARVTIEVDQMARGISRMLDIERESRELNT